VRTEGAGCVGVRVGGETQAEVVGVCWGAGA